MIIQLDTDLPDAKRAPYEEVAQLGAGGASPRGSTYARRVQSCAREHLLSNVLRWEKLPRAKALDIGLLWHGMLEIYYQAILAEQQGVPQPVSPGQQAFHFLQRFRDAEGWTDFYETCSRMMDAYVERWRHQQDWQLLAVEYTCGWTAETHPELVEQAGFELTTRLDLLIVDHSLRVTPFVRHVEHKCLVGSTRILDAATQKTCTIDELVALNKAPVVSSWDGDDMAWRRASVPFAQGTREVLEVVTRRGRRLRCTGNHPVLTPHGWVEAGRLERKSKIAVALGRMYESAPTPCADLCALLGYMLGDGAMTRRSFGKNDLGVVEDFCRRLERIDPAGRYSCAVYDGRPQVRVSTKHHLWRSLAAWGLGTCRAAEKFIPAEVMDYGLSGLRALIAGLWSTDGCIDLQVDRALRHRTPFKKPRIIYATRSQQLAVDLHEVLRRAGYDSSLKQSSVEYNGERRAYWTVQVVGDSRLHFIEDVRAGILPISRSYPVEHLAEIEALLRARDATSARAPIVWDSVETVLAVGREPVWDLSVPGTHSFVADGFVVHNSAHSLDALTVQGYSQDDQVLGQCFLGRYWVDWQREGYPAYLGALVNITTKAKAPKCERLPVQPSDAQLLEWAGSKRYWHKQAETYAADGYPKNYTQCTRRFGRCSHFDFCRGNPLIDAATLVRADEANDLPPGYRKNVAVPEEG